MSYAAIAHRLRSGRPLVLDSDTCASFRGHGLDLAHPGALGGLVRSDPARVLAHYRRECDSRVDVLSALTSDTTPRALAEIGMEHRASLLTGLALELAYEAVDSCAKPVAVAGVLGSEAVSPVFSTRVHVELEEHASRLLAHECDLIIARGLGARVELMAAVAASAATGLPTWAVVESTDARDRDALVAELSEAGATAILFEVPDVETGVLTLETVRNVAADKTFGVLLAGGADSVRGFPTSDSAPAQWARGAERLDEAGARIIGGGAGTTEAHTAALAQALGELHPTAMVPPSP